MKTQWRQLEADVIGIIAEEFRKEEDKEEAGRGSDLHLCSHPAHISHCCPGSDRGGRIGPRQCIGCQPQPIKHTTPRSAERKQRLLYIPAPIAAEPETEAPVTATQAQRLPLHKRFLLYAQAEGKKNKHHERRWHASALLFCVKSEEAIGDPSAKTRQQHMLLLAENRCLRESWQPTTILLLTEISERNTGDVPWLSPKWKEDP